MLIRAFNGRLQSIRAIDYVRMDPAHRLSRSFQLGEWLIKPEDGSLTSADKSTRLEPLQMELLVFLCARAGQVVTKDEILEKVWQGRFVSDDTVKASFYQLRKALCDTPRKPRFIETLPKRGYRVLVNPVPLGLVKDSAISQGAAADLYDKGEALLSGQPGAAALKQARLYFERATETDPGHAGATAALAHVYIHLVTGGLGKGLELMPRAKALAAHAVEIDPKFISGHVALGITRLLYDRDKLAAEKSFQLALALNPEDSTSLRWMARLHSFGGRPADAVVEARRALRADALSLAVRRDLVETLFLARSYADALAEGQQLLQMSGNAGDVRLGLSWIYFIAGDHPQAFDAVYEGFKSLGTSQEVLARAEESFRRGGMRELFRLWARFMEEQADLGQRTLDLLFLYSLLDERDRAFALLDLIVQQCHPAVLLLPASPIFDSLRGDPRYSTLLSRITGGRD